MIARPALTLAVTAALAGAAHAGTEAPPPPSKKEQRLAEKAKAREAPAAEREAARARLERELRKRVGKKPPAVVNIYNTWTHETVAIDTALAKAKTPPLPPEAMNRFLRCHFTNHQIRMDERLFGVLIAAADHFKVARVDIVSGFRAPKYNLMLRKKGRRVARNSQHTFGNAVDFRLPGVTTERLRDWARRLRLGGVGYYQGDGFVHVDTGPVRYWVE
ncbi:MAG TPA: DUF882 domain-containing protein [Kofleriaceae bacterium]|nr:DUF882 domain-containing protein [Kofleriaceae bacterium]